MSELSNSVVLFDGVCNLCNGSVNFAIDRLPESANIRFGAIQSEAGQAIIDETRLDTPAMESIIFVDDGQVWRESTAVLKIVQRMKMPWRLFYALRIIPGPIRDVVYRWVGRNRYRWFGQRESCRIPTPELMQWFLPDLEQKVAEPNSDVVRAARSTS